MRTKIISFGLLSMGLVTLLGFFGSWWWLFDILSHFKIQYFLGSLMLGLLSIWSKQKKWVVVAAVDDEQIFEAASNVNVAIIKEAEVACAEKRCIVATA